MTDYALRMMTLDGQVRLWTAQTTALCKEACQTHGLAPLAAVALGRTLTAGIMMGMNLKNEDKLTIRILGDGPLGEIVATANSSGQVKGYVKNPEAGSEKIETKNISVGEAIGSERMLYVIKDMGMKTPYTGSVKMKSGEIAEDLAQYFWESEQTPSSVGLGVLLDAESLVRAAGGFLIQAMPDADEAVLQQLEENINHLPYVSHLLDMGKKPEDIGGMILKNMPHQILEKKEISYVCDCSREKMAKGLRSLGKETLQDLFDQEEKLETRCHFCNKKYSFQEEDFNI